MRILRPARSLVVVFAFALGLTACASGGGGGSGATRGSANRITADEIQPLSQYDVHTVISRLRPAWLRSGPRGTPPGVVLNGTPQAGGIETLRSLQASNITEMQYMDAADATTRYGTGYVNGAILITTGR